MKVSVYIPTYNRSELLVRAIDSVLSQTYGNIEIVVCSDNSNDSTDEIMEGITSKYHNVHYLRNDENLGACASRNKAIEFCSGDFITGLDDDDYFEPHRISDFILALENNPGCELFFSTYNVIEKTSSRSSSCKILHGNYSDLLKSNFIGNQMFFRKSSFNEIGGFNVDLPLLQDYELWLRFLKGGGAAICVDNNSYTIDKSHAHERITNAKVDKVNKAIAILRAGNESYSSPLFSAYLNITVSNYNARMLSFRSLLYGFRYIDKCFYLSNFKAICKYILSR